MKQFEIILNKPQLPENIGFVGRIMCNFSFTDLRLINPREEFPNQKALDVSRGGRKVIENAKVYPDFSAGLSDINHLYASTSNPRFMVKDIISPKEFALETKDLEGTIGILFGPEASGLTNEEISFCKKIISIPANPEYNSLNIALSCGIILHELFCIEYPPVNNRKFEPADVREVSFLVDVVEDFINKKYEYKESKKQQTAINNVRNIFSRNNLTKQEVKTLIGIFKD